jgi:hypothetical protein
MMINPAVLQDASSIRERFQQAKPFRHVALDNCLDIWPRPVRQASSRI